MVGAEEEITQLQLENRDLDNRLSKIERNFGCPDCGSFKMLKGDGEVQCIHCNGFFIDKGGG